MSDQTFPQGCITKAMQLTALRAAADCQIVDMAAIVMAFRFGVAVPGSAFRPTDAFRRRIRHEHTQSHTEVRGWCRLTVARALSPRAQPTARHRRHLHPRERTRRAPLWVLIVAAQPVGQLERAGAFWHVETFPNRAAGEKAKRGTVLEAFGKVWRDRWAGPEHSAMLVGFTCELNSGCGVAEPLADARSPQNLAASDDSAPAVLRRLCRQPLL
jgi:hypothetical protein